MEVGKKNIEDLVTSLSNELKEIKVLQRPMLRALPWSLYGVLYIVIAIYFLGLRNDFTLKLTDPLYIYELINILAISITATFCSVWLCVPDMRGQKWLIAVPTTLFISFLFWVSLRSMMETFNTPEMEWHHCHLKSVIFGVIPAFAIWILATKGRTTHPNVMIFMNVLAVGGLGYLGLRLTCGSDDIAHLCFTHLLPYIVFGLIAALIGKRIYRW